jgi:hypothetical protein
MMKTVILVCQQGPSLGPHEGEDRWGVNTTYRIDPNLTRIYHMDSFDEYPPDERQRIISELATLDIPVVFQEPHPDIPKSEALPLGQLRGCFGVEYFTSTLAYMLADAIRMGYERIIIHRLLRLPHSIAYMEQKSCMDFWAGVAIGRGVKLEISEDSSIAKPYPWQPSLYGYVAQGKGSIASALVASAIREALRLGYEKEAA